MSISSAPQPLAQVARFTPESVRVPKTQSPSQELVTLQRRLRIAEHGECANRAELLRTREELEWTREQHAEELREVLAQRDAARRSADTRTALAALLAIVSALAVAAALRGPAPHAAKSPVQGAIAADAAESAQP